MCDACVCDRHLNNNFASALRAYKWAAQRSALQRSPRSLSRVLPAFRAVIERASDSNCNWISPRDFPGVRRPTNATCIARVASIFKCTFPSKLYGMQLTLYKCTYDWILCTSCFHTLHVARWKTRPKWLGAWHANCLRIHDRLTSCEHHMEPLLHQSQVFGRFLPATCSS